MSGSCCSSRLALPDTAAAETFPLPFSGIWHPTGSLVVFARDVLVLIVAPISIVALALFMTRTKLGLLVRASASNPDTARLYGISVKRNVDDRLDARRRVRGTDRDHDRADPGHHTGEHREGRHRGHRARAAAARPRRQPHRAAPLTPLTLVGGLAVGLFEAIVLANVDSANRSIVDLYLFLATLVLVLFVHRGRRAEASWSLAARVKPVPERLARLWYVRHLAAIGYAVLFGILAVLPVFLTQRSQEFLWTDVVIFAMAALPISLLIGWAGQVSLGQFTFVGLGGLTMVVLTQGIDIPVPFALFSMSARLPWLVAVVLSTAVGVVASVIVGVPALRVRGLLLAVITFAFGVAATSWLFGQSVFTGSEFNSTTPPIRPPVLGPFDLADRRTFYYVCLACLFVLTLMVARLRRTGVGRSMIAVRDNEEMAAASTVSSPRVRLVAFALSGGMAAFAGCLFVTLRTQVNPTATFTSEGSLRLVSTAIIGGLGSVTGPVLGALFVRGLPVIFGDVQVGVVAHLSGIGLLVLLLYFPGGSCRSFTIGWCDVVFRLGRANGAGGRWCAPQPCRPRRPGGRRTGANELSPAAVHAWLGADRRPLRWQMPSTTCQPRRARGELVGLIGTNGAGKSTLLNAIGGFVPSTGTIDVLGADVSDLPGAPAPPGRPRPRVPGRAALPEPDRARVADGGASRRASARGWCRR